MLLAGGDKSHRTTAMGVTDGPHTARQALPTQAKTLTPLPPAQ